MPLAASVQLVTEQQTAVLSRQALVKQQGQRPAPADGLSEEQRAAVLAGPGHVRRVATSWRCCESLTHTRMSLIGCTHAVERRYVLGMLLCVAGALALQRNRAVMRWIILEHRYVTEILFHACSVREG